MRIMMIIMIMMTMTTMTSNRKDANLTGVNQLDYGEGV